MIILDGVMLSEKIKENLKKEIEKMKYQPGITVVLVGEDPASKVYVNMKHKNALDLGMKSETIKLPENTDFKTLLKVIDELNNDDTIDAILVQSPLPKHLDEQKMLEYIDPAKDVDCFHPFNVGKLLIGNGTIAPCTPAGIIELLKEYKINTSGLKTTIIGRSNIVGKPLIPLLLRENCTVTVCHTRTKDLKAECLNSDMLIVAAGKQGLVTADMVKDGAIVIDVGINQIKDDSKKGYHLEGDVDFDSVSKKASYITPVPGGIGPMTRAMLMKNCIELAKARRNKAK
jgi:methylenetetrahydrofolate dehydrogenase (NADP+)/methenyltetrahydrofolate cyclohydrolase